MPKRPKYVDYAVIGLCVVITCALLSSTMTVRSNRGDLWVVVHAALDFLSDGTVYVLDDNPHTKPPLATLASIPLTWIPFPWLERIWDVLNLAAFLGMGWVLLRWLDRPKCGLSNLAFLCLAILMVENQWNAEIRFGQYNVLLACLVLVGPIVRPFFAGVLFFFAVLFKPVNLAFLPWALQQSRSRAAFVVGNLSALAVVVATYLYVRGGDRMLSEHLAWIGFMKGATATMLGWKALNYGIPRLFVDWGVSVAAVVQWFPIGTLVLGGLIPWICGKENRAVSFSLVAAMLVVTSPLAWSPNYSLLLGYALVVWNTVLETWKRESATAGEKALSVVPVAALYVGLQLHNPETIRMGIFGPVTPVPLWGALISMGAFALLTLLPQGRLTRIPTRLTARAD